MDKWDQGDKVQRGGTTGINHMDLGKLSQTERSRENILKGTRDAPESSASLAGMPEYSPEDYTFK